MRRSSPHPLILRRRGFFITSAARCDGTDRRNAGTIRRKPYFGRNGAIDAGLTESRYGEERPARASDTARHLKEQGSCIEQRPLITATALRQPSTGTEPRGGICPGNILDIYVDGSIIPA